MTKFSKTMFASAFAAALGATAAAEAITIDDFSNPAFQEVERNSIAGLGITGGTALGGGILGGERDVLVEVTNVGVGVNEAQVKVGSLNANMMSFDVDSSMQAKASVIWDGMDADANVVDYLGLGGVDLTTGGNAFGIGLHSLDQSGVEVLLTVWTDADHWSQLTLVLNETDSLVNYFAEFGDFLPGVGALGAADFKNVGAVRLDIDPMGLDAIDLKLDFVVTTTTAVPEPASMALFSIGGLAILARRRRKQTA